MIERLLKPQVMCDFLVGPILSLLDICDGDLLYLFLLKKQIKPQKLTQFIRQC
jgi:hypothetical protein